MGHLPPPTDTIPDVLTHYQSGLAVGLYTNPIPPESVTQLSDLIGDVDFPEPDSTSFPGYARFFPTWTQLANDPTYAALAGQAAWVAAENPPDQLDIEGWFLVSATAGAPALMSFGQFPGPMPIAAAGDGLVVPLTVSATQADSMSPATVSSSSSVVRVSRAQTGRVGFGFRGQDRRMVQQLLKALVQTQAHDGRVPLLSPRTRRAEILILDPQDPDQDLASAAQSLVDRCFVLLSL